MTPDPEIVPDDGACPAHRLWAMWQDGDETAHIGFWMVADGRIVVNAAKATTNVRGRAMLDWLGGYGAPVTVVEVVPDAMPFWEAMTREGLVDDWEPADGGPSPLETDAVPFTITRSMPEGMGRITRIAA